MVRISAGLGERDAGADADSDEVSHLRDEPRDVARGVGVVPLANGLDAHATSSLFFEEAPSSGEELELDPMSGE